MDDLPTTSHRASFSLPDDLHYLNCASRSPFPVATVEAGRRAVEDMAVPRSKPPEQYFAAPEAVRSLIGRLVGTGPDTVAFLPAVSYGVAIAARNWHVEPGSTVVVAEGEFPSDVYAWMAACERTGAEMRTVCRPEPGDGFAARWSAALVDAIDERTAVVALSTVLWGDGTALDLVPIAARAREAGALVVVDATQSLGAAELDLGGVAPDLLVCSAYKWLFCPDQFAFAVIGERLIDGRPLEHHWSNRAGSEDTTGTGLRDTFRPGARRFDVGGHNNGIALAMARASLEMVLSWEPGLVQDHCDRLLEPLVGFAADGPYTVLERASRMAHIVGVGGEQHLLDRAMDELRARDVAVSRRGTSIRVSPNLYNTPGDVDALVDGLAAAI